MKATMTKTLNRRSLLAGLAAVSTAPWIGCSAPAPARPLAPTKLTNTEPLARALDHKAVAAIAASYKSETNDPVGDDVLAALAPNGTLSTAAIKEATASDFTEGRLFTHAGWRLSHTEGRLFTLLSRI